MVASIPPGTLRISVTADGDTYGTDLPAAKLAETLRAFADFAGTDAGSESCKAVAAEASENGDEYLIAVAALWLFVREPGAGSAAMNRERVDAILKSGGAALLTVMVGKIGEDWKFRLCEMPSTLASLAPY